MALERDAYFTPVEDSSKIIKQLLIDHPEVRDLEFVEPSAGSGSFMYAAEEHGLNIKGYDIHPLRQDVIKNDFLNDDLDLSGKFVIGNPPYGRKNSLTIKFIERAFEQGAEYVGFLLLGGFAQYFNITRIKEKCEIISIRRYRVIFVNENGEKVKVLASDFSSIFIVLKKSNTLIKDLFVKNIFEIINKKEDFKNADFYLGSNFYSLDIPAILDMNSANKEDFYLKGFKNNKSIRGYKTSILNKELVQYLSKLRISGKPTANTLNFYSTYPKILKDLN